MNEPIINQESKESTSASMLFGLPRPITGTLAGVICFLVLVLIFNVWDTEDGLLQAALLAPGFWAVMFFRIDAPIAFYLISSFPPAIIGSLIASSTKALRIRGIILLVIYLIVSVPLGKIALIFAHIAFDL